jgi:hypothetical protein
VSGKAPFKSVTGVKSVSRVTEMSDVWCQEVSGDVVKCVEVSDRVMIENLSVARLTRVTKPTAGSKSAKTQVALRKPSIRRHKSRRPT